MPPRRACWTGSACSPCSRRTRPCEGSHGALADVDRSRVGVFVGTGMGGTLTMDSGYRTLYGDDSDRIKPFTILMGMHNAPRPGSGSSTTCAART